MTLEGLIQPLASGVGGPAALWVTFLAGLLASAVAFTLWGMWATLGSQALGLLALSLVTELVGSVPFYVANAELIFADE